MKKSLIFILVILIILGVGGVFFWKEKKENKNIENNTSKNEPQNVSVAQTEKEPDSEYIETVPENAKKFIELYGDENLILTEEEISNYNEEIKSKADMVYNLEELENQPKGIIVKRANLRSIPSDNINTTNGTSDKNQETELHVNTPVVITKESDDGLWNYVTSSFYVGWVKKENVAIATDEDFNFFIYNENFGIITDSTVTVNDVVLDMSVKLPYIGVTEEGYKFVLPKMGEDGYVSKEEVIIGRDKSHIGYLPYTKKNLYIQAFKYEGVNYSWGGKDIGVDCSSYVGNVYRTFGIYFPRNTSSQNKSVGKITYLSDKTESEKLEIIKNTNPSLLYQSGHVMIYLGEIDGKDYIIHASGKEMKVAVTELENSSYIKSIDRLILVN